MTKGKKNQFLGGISMLKWYNTYFDAKMLYWMGRQLISKRRYYSLQT
jgi:hypothetical protein